MIEVRGSSISTSKFGPGLKFYFMLFKKLKKVFRYHLGARKLIRAKIFKLSISQNPCLKTTI